MGMAGHRWGERHHRAVMLLVSAVVVMLVAGESAKLVEAVTDAGDIEALKQVKVALNQSSIMSSTCMGSWDFSVDPCDPHAGPHFICGIDCSRGKGGTFRVVGIRLESSAGYMGPLSPFIGNLSALQVLVISGNNFQGSIPATLAHCRELSELDLSVNSFSGLLPESLGLLANLVFLSVAFNALSGPIPVSFNNLANLTHMYLNNNGLTKSIPTFTGMKSLYYMDASSNNFTGPLMTTFPPSLTLLSLRSNRFIGHLPTSLRNLTLLEALDLRDNHLSGNVDAFIFLLPSLQQLNLSYNLFTSVDAFNLSGISNSELLSLDLSFNRIQGGLPESMANLKKLTVLALRSNLFTGPIPYTYALKAANSLNGTEQLGQLYLDNNFLSGNIPSPLLRLSPDTISANFVNNCLRSCPPSLFFCQGGTQKSLTQCKASAGLV